MATILDWPMELLMPSSMTWSLNHNGTLFTSKFNNSTQTVTYPGSMWQCEMVFQNLDDYESRYLESLMFQMGVAGKIRIPDMGRYGRPPMGAPVVTDAGQSGFALKTGGWIPSRLVMQMGDYMSVNNELKMVLKDVISDANGLATLPIAPMLRNSPAAGAVVEVFNPTGIFRLDKNQSSVDRKPAYVNDINISLIETFYI